MTLIDSVIDTFKKATEHNLDDALREGSLLNFPDYGQVVMTGDLHGHQRNFEKIVKFCQLESTPIRHVILHEMIHEEPQYFGEADYSVELLIDAAKWKTFFPEQVHFLQTSYIAGADPLSLEAWRRRAPSTILGDNIAKLVTPLL